MKTRPECCLLASQRWLSPQWAAVILLATAPMSGAAASDDDVELARTLVEQGRILPLEMLLARAQRLRPGVPIEVELDAQRDPRTYVYKIEMLDREGAVWEIEFDAETGQLVSLHADED